jgi:peroxiredoxin
MIRDCYQAMLWCAVLTALVGCGTAEKQAAAPPQAKQQAEVATDPPLASEADRAKPPAIRRDEAVKQVAAEEPVKEPAPQRRTVFYRLDAGGPAVMPKVVLSVGHEALCKVKVGDVLPAVELPVVRSNDRKKPADLYGKKATAVLFWDGNRRMSREALADLGPDVVDLFGNNGVAVVGIAVNETAANAKAALEKAGANFANLLDADGKAFALVGSERLPRVFLVDSAGKILWFDIEYSQTTRRELHQALHAATGAPPEEPADAASAAKPQAVGGK